jgi:2-dehydro-3-deoxyphosphogluconate aldolase/(4S)-4-hydroxy-2-oxoglutarate aldolase
MTSESILRRLGEIRIIPVVVIDDEQNAEPLAEALQRGGLATMEITLRTDSALEAIRRIGGAFPDMLLGAGTVLTTGQAQRAVDAGARYIVSPGLNRKVVEWCLANAVPVTPGVITPTEIEEALELGLEVVKFFPAEAGGGITYLKAVSAPYRGLKFIPTGGIDESNVAGYLKLSQVLACGGSWMVKADLIRARSFDEIRRMSAEAAALASRIPPPG